jgi:hypothetical protein
MGGGTGTCGGGICGGMDGGSCKTVERVLGPRLQRL